MRTPAPWLLLVLTTLVVGCSSPAAIVEAAVDAAERNDRGDYIACFTPRSRPLLSGLYSVADAANPTMATLGSADVQITEVRPMSVGHEGQDRAMVTINEQGRSLSLVVHAEAGAWRIDLMDTERILTGLGGTF